MRMFSDDAVSPVVGVMLMLVVTIIIAAVVSGFAGSLTSDNAKTPQMTLSAKYSQTCGLVLMHSGGDPLTTTNLKVVIRPSTQFSRYADQWAQTIPNVNITNSDGKIWVAEVYSFIPGDSAYVDADAITKLQDGVFAKGERINNPDNVGKTIGVELYDAKSNSIIAKVDTIVEA